jgi:hypothetical protein
MVIMNLEDIKSKAKIAQEAVKDVDKDLREIAFEVILKKLLESGVPTRETKVSQTLPEKKKTKGVAPVSLAPIPLDLKGGNDVPSLRDFYNEKAPANNQEKVTVFAYYIKKYLKISDVLPGHVISCYNEVNEKKPLQIVQLFRDTKHSKGWLETGDTPNTAKISIAGENLVEHDLPRPKE